MVAALVISTPPAKNAVAAVVTTARVISPPREIDRKVSARDSRSACSAGTPRHFSWATLECRNRL